MSNKRQEKKRKEEQEKRRKIKENRIVIQHNCTFNIKLRLPPLPIMVETKEEAVPSDAHGLESSGDKKTFSGGKAFKRKNKSGHMDKKNEGAPKLLKGVSFSISRDGPDMYLKAVKSLGIYVCTTYKIRSDVQMCLYEEELILPEGPILPDNPTPHQRKMWDLRAAAAIRNEDSLKQNLKSLFTVVMSLCDSIMEDRVSCHKEYVTIKRVRDTIKLLKIIKQIMYSNGAACLYLIKWCNNYVGRHLPLSVMTRKSLKKAERKRKSRASDVQRWAITRVNARKNCPKKLQRKG